MREFTSQKGVDPVEQATGLVYDSDTVENDIF